MTASPLRLPSLKPYVEVAIPLPVFQTYHYAAPAHLSPGELKGKRVLIPFGQRQITGYVLDVCTTQEITDIKTILDVLDETPLFPESMIPFFKWIADYYVHPLGEVIKCALPGGLNHHDFLTVAITPQGKKALETQQLTPLETELLKHIGPKTYSLKSLYKKASLDFPMSLVHQLKNKGMILVQREMKMSRTGPKMERYVSITSGSFSLDALSQKKRDILALLRVHKTLPVRELNRIIPSALQPLNSLKEAGHIFISQRWVYRDPFGEPIEADQAHILTPEQSHVIEKIEKDLGKGFKPYLLDGVTGSGKTEIYLQLTEKTIALGHTVLVLVPEIALISQMEKRFRARFGECVALLHSGLSAGERYDQWMRVVRREVTIVIGARSAVFAPLDHIGLIIVDEEHDTSYKQEGSLRYHARDLAVVRSNLQQCVVLMGSATPSVQSYYNVMIKKYHEVTLTQRVEQRPLPKIQLVDLRKRRNTRGVGTYITPELYQAMKETLDRKEQVLLFLNRRGFAGYPVCSVCGTAIRCKNCDISLTLHQADNAYKCHYCGYTRPSTIRCLSCGSTKIRLLGLGTEKIETTVKTLFPQARVARMDGDTTIRKGSILTLLKSLKNGSIDILIGTQMIAKGHDFPNITLVGIICADLTLSFPDFRAAERTFQLLAQVSGRAGRGEIPGRVILQTYNPDHFSIVSAKNQDFKSFFSSDIGYRKALHYPPFSRMVLLKLSGRDQVKTAQHANHVADLCHNLSNKKKSSYQYVTILGPIEAPLPRIAKAYRWQILLKGLRTEPLKRFVRELLFENSSQVHHPSVKLAVDVDPFFLM